MIGLSTLSVLYFVIILWIPYIYCTSVVKINKSYNASLEIEPIWIRRGQSVRLFCNYDLAGDPLYSVKWYRGHFEFYRYSPSEKPPAKIFPFADIKVDLSASNATQVTLRNVGFRLSGNFSCEVTADAPSFHTSVASSVLTVVELPHAPPTIWTEREKYDPGDILRANCSSPPSKPGASISFLLNEIPVGHEPTLLHSVQDGLQWSSRDLSIQLLPSHYNKGQLTLKCRAEVADIYLEATVATLWSLRKEPIPERVTSPSKGVRHIHSYFGGIHFLQVLLFIITENFNLSKIVGR